jgi:hypothetical protein
MGKDNNEPAGSAIEIPAVKGAKTSPAASAAIPKLPATEPKLYIKSVDMKIDTRGR